jgi:hypothetical protein
VTEWETRGKVFTPHPLPLYVRPSSSQCSNRLQRSQCPNASYLPLPITSNAPKPPNVHFRLCYLQFRLLVYMRFTRFTGFTGFTAFTHPTRRYSPFALLPAIPITSLYEIHEIHSIHRIHGFHGFHPPNSPHITPTPQPHLVETALRETTYRCGRLSHSSPPVGFSCSGPRTACCAFRQPGLEADCWIPAANARRRRK